MSWGTNLNRDSDYSGAERCDRFFAIVVMSGRDSTSRGGEPELKRRRLLDAGGPIEDEETARQKMREARVGENNSKITGFYSFCFTGFNPDDVAGLKSKGGTYEGDEISPMGYFCREGDLPMVRWLYVNGADTRDEDVGYYFPMYMAAVNGHVEVCKWLWDHGAVQDVKRRTVPRTFRPLRVTFSRPERRNVSRWLILRGAMCKDFQSGELDIDVMKEDLAGCMHAGHSTTKRLVEELLLEWANNLHEARTSFLLFLSGTLSPPNHADATRQTSSPLGLLSGKAGVLQSIGDYFGFVCGREARIIRQLTELLPDLNKELDAESK